MKILKKSLAYIMALSLTIGNFAFGNSMQLSEGSNNSIVVSATTNNDMYVDSSSDVFASNMLGEYFFNSSSPNNNYLQANDDGSFNRIVYSSDIVTIETYSSSFELMSTNTIEMELSIWGAFYSGSEYNFCVFGEANPDEDDNAEVIRIVKYSKDWQRLDSVGISACNTETPFRAGRPRLTECDGKLYLHTSHRMYQTDDGLRHQANMDFYFNIDDMSIFYAQYNVANIDYTGYISHSFDQYITNDNQNIYTLDLGDAFPRSVCVIKRDLDGTLIGNVSALDIYGNIGDNTTGVTLGGFETSTDNCLVLGNSINQDGTSTDNNARNIFLSVVNKDLSSSEFIWLTDYSDTDLVSAPKLVKIDDDNFIAMWNELSSEEVRVARFVKLNGNGDILEDVSIEGVSVSDCDPIILNDELVWYSCGSTYDEYGWINGDFSRIYHLDYNNLSKYNNPSEEVIPTNILGDLNNDGDVNTVDLILLKKYVLGVDVTLINTGDLNDDGNINVLDVIDLKKHLLGIRLLGDNSSIVTTIETPMTTTETSEFTVVTPITTPESPLITTIPSGTTTTAPITTTQSFEELKQEYIQEVVDLVNEERVSNGLSPLTISEDLLQMTDIRANEIIVKFSHVRPNGEECFSVKDEVPTSLFVCAENIAMGQENPNEVIYNWFNSEGHYSNIMNPNATHIGVGIATDGYDLYWVQLFGYEY